MLRRFLNLVACVAISLGIAGNGQAAILAQNSTPIEVTAQTYSQDFSVTPGTYSNVTLNLFAKGDYDLYPYEYIKLSLDGVTMAEWWSSTPGLTTFDNITNYDYTLTGVFPILDSLFNSMVSDGNLNVSWMNGPEVNAYPTIGGIDYVTWSVQADSAPVPEPSTIFLLGAGIAGLGFARRRSKK